MPWSLNPGMRRSAGTVDNVQLIDCDVERLQQIKCYLVPDPWYEKECRYGAVVDVQLIECGVDYL
jgi:hypothetical protein